MTAPDYKMMIMSYGDGIPSENLDTFIEAIRLFDKQSKNLYEGKKIKYYFLPEEMVEMLDAAQKETE